MAARRKVRLTELTSTTPVTLDSLLSERKTQTEMTASVLCVPFSVGETGQLLPLLLEASHLYCTLF